MYLLETICILLTIAAFIIINSIKMLKEYERGVVFTLGRFWKIKGPGIIMLIPGIQQMHRVSLRTVVYDMPPQDVISKDNVSVYVNAVVYFRVVNPERAVIEVENFFEATSQVAQTTLRSVLGQHDLDEMLSARDKLNLDIQRIIDEQTDRWGIKVSIVEIKKIDLAESMIRAIARQAEAERERRAKVIHAQGELQASEALSKAAAVLGTQPEALQLRYLQTLSDIATDKSSTIVFPIPIDLLKAFQTQLAKTNQEEK
jgi:regulator of protease activity HflC (stomatin/prohibitin superfamily)